MSNTSYVNGMSKILCGNCDLILAMVQNREVRIHLKDTFVYLTGGMIRIVCVGCCSENYYVDPEFELSNPRLLDGMKGKTGVYNVKIERWISRRDFKQQNLKGNHNAEQAIR